MEHRVCLSLVEQNHIKDGDRKSNTEFWSTVSDLFRVTKQGCAVEVCRYDRFIEFEVDLPRGTRIQIAFARLRLWPFYAVAEVVLDDAALFFVADRLRSLSAFAASDRAEAPIGKYPWVFRCSNGLLLRHRVLVMHLVTAGRTSGNRLKRWKLLITVVAK